MNKVMLIGNLGTDPLVRYYDADQAVAQFRLATTERGYTLPNGTRVPDRTDWHNIVMWKSLAKTAERYLHKGDKVFIEGSIRYRSYDDKKGQRQLRTEIYADSMELLSLRSSREGGTVAQGQQGSGTMGQQGYSAGQPGVAAGQPGGTPGGPAQTPGGASACADDSNLPF